MDLRLSRLAIQYNLHYSRYSDDITFSGSLDISLNTKFIEELKLIIKESGFEINQTKTRCQRYTQRQIVTGLIVNEKLNIKRKFVKEIRSLLHIWEKYGINAAKKSYLEYHAYVRKEFDPYGAWYSVFCGPEEAWKSIGIEKIILGKIAFIGQVKGRSNPLYLNLRKRIKRICLDNKS